MGQCSNKIFTELFEEEEETDDSEEWRNQGIRKKTVHSKGVLRSTKDGGKFAVAEFKETDEIKARREFYRFGSRNLYVLRPNDNDIQQQQQEDQDEIRGDLELFYAHGYNGRFLTCRQNLYLSHDQTCLLYFIAGVCVNYNIKTKKQKFFDKHNDDITTICLSPKSLNKPWAASGQKDPKDLGGKNGKDLPKIWIWNYETMQSVQLIDNVCWGKIEKLQWSEKSKYLYCICGDDDHTLKIYDSSEFGGDNDVIKPIYSEATIKDKIYGFTINPYNNNDSIIDEIIIFGKHSFKHILIRVGFPLFEKTTVSIRKFGKIAADEKSFGCAKFINDEYYAVGSQSGNIYICKGNKATKMIKSHDKSIGDLYWISNEKLLVSASYDDKIKYWKFESNSLKNISEFEVNNLDPRTLIINEKQRNQMFVGTKNNEIIQIDADTQNSEIIINGHDGEIWGLATHPKKKIFASGSYDTCIKLWNAETNECIFTYKLPNIKSKKKKGKKKKQKKNFIRCGTWSSNGKLLVFGTEDSYIYLFSYNDNNDNDEEMIKLEQVLHIPRRSRRAPIEAVTALRFSEDDQILGCTHFDSKLYLFDVIINENDIDLKQWHATMDHIAAPICLQFGIGIGNDNKTGGKNVEIIKTFTRDYEIVHWILNREERDCRFCPWIPAQENILWFGQPIIAGYDVKGCYQSNLFDGTDLNDIVITKDEKLVISVDDFATVRMHNYPAIHERKCKQYKNKHCEFIVGCKLLFDDSQLITVGGADRTIFQWKLNKLYQEEDNTQEKHDQVQEEYHVQEEREQEQEQEQEEKQNQEIQENNINLTSNVELSGSDKVRVFFEDELNLGEYVNIMIENGFERMDLLYDLTSDDLKEMNVKIAHRKQIIKALQSKKQDDE